MPSRDRYITETRAFSACRAASWNTRFGDDMAAYAAAVAQAGIPRGGVVIAAGRFFAVAIRE